jgi:glycosyltransferase involved in cell wall biosynthesis
MVSARFLGQRLEDFAPAPMTASLSHRPDTTTFMHTLEPNQGKRLAFLLPDMRGGGAERVALTLMADFVERGYEIDLLLCEAAGELLPLLPPSIRVVDLRAPRIRNAILPLRRYLRERKPLAMQVSMWPLTAVAVIAHRLAGSTARLVLSDHVALSKQYGASAGTMRLLSASTKLLYPLADATVVVSEDAAADLAMISGIRREDLEVVYNPVPAPAVIEGTPDIEAMWGSSGKRILTVGSLKEQKNHLLLIRSFARLRRKLDAKLMILGGGELLPKLQAEAASEGVAEDVIFPGFSVDPWPFYASADLFALSSDYEGYPLVMIEAMRAGLPVVSTDCRSGPREILGGGDYGELVPCGDAEALADAMAAALGKRHDPKRIKARAEQLSGADTSARYLELMLGRLPDGNPAAAA